MGQGATKTQEVDQGGRDFGKHLREVVNSLRAEENVVVSITSENHYISIVKSLVINKLSKSVFVPMDVGLIKPNHVNLLNYFLYFLFLFLLFVVV